MNEACEREKVLPICERVLYNYCIIIMDAYIDGDNREAEGPVSRATMIMMIIIMIIIINNNDNDDV